MQSYGKMAKNVVYETIVYCKNLLIQERGFPVTALWARTGVEAEQAARVLGIVFHTWYCIYRVMGIVFTHSTVHTLCIRGFILEIVLHTRR